MSARPGHSLPELIVAVTFLGVALTGVGASSVLGARWAMDAVRKQEALRLAAATLDSLRTAPNPGSGRSRTGTWSVEWLMHGDERVRVTVSSLDGRRFSEIEGRRTPPIAVLRDSAVAPVQGLP